MPSRDPCQSTTQEANRSGPALREGEERVWVGTSYLSVASQIEPAAAEEEKDTN